MVLRPFRDEDVDDVFDYATDPEWARHLPVPRPYTRLAAEQFVGAAIGAVDGTRLVWAITREGRVSGSINLWILEPGAGEIGYDIARRLWGRGLATEAAVAVVAFGFGSLGLGRIEATADIRNAASWRVMEKLGMQREGPVRMDGPVPGERVDGVRYVVRREEWLAREHQRRSEG